MTGLLRRIPYALKNARKELIAAVAKKNSHNARICIERFVDALYEIPNGREELRRRATLIESLAGAGSDYEISRAQALPSYRGQPRRRSRSQIAIGRLRKSVGTPLFLVEVTRDRRGIEWVLEGGDLNLTPTARQAYKSWQNACRAIQKEAGPLEVDGCWYLFHLYEAGEANPSQYAEYAKVFTQVKSGGGNLESIKAAANSLVDWVRNEIPHRGPASGVEVGEAYLLKKENDPAGTVSNTKTDADNGHPAEPSRDHKRTTKDENKFLWLAKAMLLVQDHPDWSNATIAKLVGKHPCTLSRSTQYRLSARLARGSKTDLTGGYVTVDSDSGLRDVEAAAPMASGRDDKSDRGQPIPGSKFLREYCEECGESMKVQAAEMGKKPVCKDCKR